MAWNNKANISISTSISIGISIMIMKFRKEKITETVTGKYINVYRLIKSSRKVADTVIVSQQP